MRRRGFRKSPLKLSRLSGVVQSSLIRRAAYLQQLSKKAALDPTLVKTLNKGVEGEGDEKHFFVRHLLLDSLRLYRKHEAQNRRSMPTSVKALLTMLEDFDSKGLEKATLITDTGYVTPGVTVENQRYEEIVVNEMISELYFAHADRKNTKSLRYTLPSRIPRMSDLYKMFLPFYDDNPATVGTKRQAAVILAFVLADFNYYYMLEHNQKFDNEKKALKFPDINKRLPTGAKKNDFRMMSKREIVVLNSQSRIADCTEKPPVGYTQVFTDRYKDGARIYDVYTFDYLDPRSDLIRNLTKDQQEKAVIGHFLDKPIYIVRSRYGAKLSKKPELMPYGISEKQRVILPDVMHENPELLDKN